MQLEKGDGSFAKKKIAFNLSQSSLNVFLQSPLLFYLTYIEKVPDDTPVPLCYGLSGNIIHSCLEKYAKKELDKEEVFDFFASQWAKQNMEEHLNIQDEPLDQNDYITALIRGLKVVDSHEEHICEELIQFPFVENDQFKIGIKGIVDLQAKPKGSSQPIVIDYKTSNSVNKGREFERQAMFYSYLINRKKNSIPAKTVFHYLKLGVTKEYSFSKEDIIAFEEELKVIANQILEYGTDINKYPVGDIDDLFNSKKKACIKEVNRRMGFSERDFLENSQRIENGADLEIFDRT